MSRPSSRPGSPGLGSSPRGSVVNLQQYAADAKISSHRGEEVQTGLINGEQKAQAAPTSAGEFGSQCVSMVLWLGSSGGSCRVVFFRWDRTESVPAGETRLEGEQIDTNGGESCVRTIELGKTHRLVSVRAHLASSSSCESRASGNIRTSSLLWVVSGSRVFRDAPTQPMQPRAPAHSLRTPKVE